MATAAWSYDPNKYAEGLKKAGATIKPSSAIPGTGYGQVIGAARSKDGLQPFQAPASPLTLPSGTVGSPNISTGMASAYAAPKPQVVSQSAPAQGTQGSHQAYINKSTPGGMSAYQKTQQGRYDQAYASGDQDLIGKLNADVQRVGYSLMIPQGLQTGQTGQVGQQDPNAWANDAVMAELANTKLAIEQELASLKQASELAVNQNNQMLNENIAKLTTMKNQNDLQIQETENRFGGTYSGGMRLGQASNAKAATEATNNVQRDTATRNADIWGRNALLASQAAEKISLLTQQAPAKIRELIMGKQERDQDFAIRESGVTGMYNGQPTPDGIAQSLTNEINRLKLQQLPTELKLGLTALENDVKVGALNLQEAQIKLKELQDPNSITNKARTLALEADRLGNQELKKRIEFIGYKPPMTDAEARLQQIELDKAEIELTNLKNGGSEKYSGMTANQIMDSVRSKYSETQYGPSNILGQPGPKVGEKLTSDPAKREQMFLEVVDSGLPSDTETMQVLRLLGLSKEEIDRYVKKHSGN